MRGNLATSEQPVQLATGLDIRLAARSGALDAPTAGLRAGLRAGQLAILPHDHAEDRVCLANPKPCPLLGVSEKGDPAIPALGAISTSAPTFRATGSGATASWRRAARHPKLGATTWSASCSAARFRFEEALLAADVPLRPYRAWHATCRCWHTSQSRSQRGRSGFARTSGRLDASAETRRMRSRTVQITYAAAEAAGARRAGRISAATARRSTVADITKPDTANAVPVDTRRDAAYSGACGVTPHARRSRPSTSAVRDHEHAPGFMLVTDLKNAQLDDVGLGTRGLQRRVVRRDRLRGTMIRAICSTDSICSPATRPACFSSPSSC